MLEFELNPKQSSSQVHCGSKDKFDCPENIFCVRSLYFKILYLIHL